jgi:uncharacterized membrane protein
MRYRVIALFSIALCALALTAPAGAQDAAKSTSQDTPKTDVKGMFLLTDFPAISLRPGSSSTVNLRLQNYSLPPERLVLSIAGVPQGWTATLIGGGQPVQAALPATNANVALELRLDVPKEAAMGTTNLTVSAKGANTDISLPIAVTTVKDLPAKLAVNPQLPDLRGNSKSTFEYQLSIKNESGKKVVVALAATAPQNFDATFTEQYGSQELSALPLDAGQSKDVKLKVKPPNTVAAGKYQVSVKASAEDASVNTDLGLEVTGQPKLDISGREGLLSSRASAGVETSVPILITNSGTAPADSVELSGSGPSGWKVTFEPKTIDSIPPNENKEVQALITPTVKAIAGDYVATLRASARGESASQTFRVAVTTSTMWGIIGALLIGVALLVMVGAVARFGRR